MSGRNSQASTEHLLAHSRWMRALARKLVGDVQGAEDLTQETWVRALEKPPRTDVPLRGWLATVMRNLARQDARGTSRRSEREARAAHGEPEGSSLELLEKVTTQGEILEAVLGLEEPYRQTILLRYFEERSPRRIAAEGGVPVSTVKTRLSRGLQRLRTKLDRHYGGDGRAWIAALLPVARDARVPWSLPRPSSLELGALAVNAKFIVAAVSLTAIGATYAVWSTRSAPAGPAEVATAHAMDAVFEPLVAPLERETSGAPLGRDARQEVPATAAAAPATEPVVEVAAADLRVRGRVIDVGSRPVAGVAVRAGARSSAAGAARPASSGGSATTSADGTFELEAEGGMGRLTVDDERYATVLAGTPVGIDTAKESVIVVAPRLFVSGWVMDEFGLPVAGANVHLRPPASLRADLELVLDYSAEVLWSEESDEEGYFEFEVAPALVGAELVATRDGLQPHREPAPTLDSHDLVLVLLRPELTSRTLTGEVLDAGGTPVERALVSMGIDTTRSDESGGFAFDLDARESFNASLTAFIDVDTGRLMAAAPGYLPAELEARGRDESGRPIWPDHVVLRLGLEPYSIAGRVVDDLGEPLGGVRVWVADPTTFGGLGDPAIERFPDMTTAENLIMGRAPGWSFEETDADGRFRIEGLLDREYTLEAMDPANLLRVAEPAVRAGRDNLRLVLPAEAVYEVLRGRLVDSRGGPVASASIATSCDAFVTRVGGRTIGTRHARGELTTRSDEEGRFELYDVPRDLVYLRIDGADTIPLEWGRAVEGGLGSLIGEEHDDLEITVHRRCNFQVEIAVAGEADEIAILDGEGQVLTLSEFQGNGRRDGPRLPIVNGRTATLGVGDAGETLVLFKNGAEVRRTSIQLVPGERVTIRP